MIRQFAILAVVIMAASCASPNGRLVTAERLSRFEGGGSLSTLWYYGSDGEYHYFRHLWKSSTPYRVKQDEFEWRPEFKFDGYEGGKLVRYELSDHVLEAQGINILDRTYKGSVFDILAARDGKDPNEKWEVDTHEGFVRIRKSRTDGKVFPPGSSVEFWREDDNGNWIPNPTA
jgi:hypothetical protein